jgi:hypothetical protein
MKLFAEAQIERIEAMTPEELDEALRAQGLDPNAPFDIEEMIAKLPPEQDSAAPSQAVPSAVAPPVAPAPVTPAPVTPARAASSPAAPITPLEPKRSSRRRLSPLVWIALPAAAAVLVALGLPNGPDSNAVARAAELRDEAARSCRQQRWDDCAQSLDQARKLDPAGESREGVVELREAIARADQPGEKKPAPPEPTFKSPELEVKPRIPPQRR